MKIKRNNRRADRTPAGRIGSMIIGLFFGTAFSLLVLGPILLLVGHLLLFLEVSAPTGWILPAIWGTPIVIAVWGFFDGEAMYEKMKGVWDTIAYHMGPR